MDNNSNEQVALNQIDTKVILKFKKFKGKNKTYIYGLEQVMEKQKLDDFLKKIKKKLGCGGVFSEDDQNVKMIEFMGDHREKIKEFLLEDKIISADKIEIKGA